VISVLIADDHTIVRQGLRRILSLTPDIQVQGEAANGRELMEQIRRQDWDVILLDMSMPGRSGIDLIKQIKHEKPKQRILVLTMHAEEQYVARAFKAGVTGYLTKEGADTELVAALRKVACGNTYMSDLVSESVALNLRTQTSDFPHTELSDREFDVFQRIVHGQTNSEIADQLSISVKTVSTYKTRILEKMRMETSSELIRYAIKHKL
jgi:two-component system, NarL family, invasion response regulator UvrY